MSPNCRRLSTRVAFQAPPRAALVSQPNSLSTSVRRSGTIAEAGFVPGRNENDSSRRE